MKKLLALACVLAVTLTAGAVGIDSRMLDTNSFTVYPSLTTPTRITINTNTVNGLIDARAVSPTNGVTATQATNIANSVTTTAITNYFRASQIPTDADALFNFTVKTNGRYMAETDGLLARGATAGVINYVTNSLVITNFGSGAGLFYTSSSNAAYISGSVLPGQAGGIVGIEVGVEYVLTNHNSSNPFYGWELNLSTSQSGYGTNNYVTIPAMFSHLTFSPYQYQPELNTNGLGTGIVGSLPYQWINSATRSTTRTFPTPVDRDYRVLSMEYPSQNKIVLLAGYTNQTYSLTAPVLTNFIANATNFWFEFYIPTTNNSLRLLIKYVAVYTHYRGSEALGTLERTNVTEFSGLFTGDGSALTNGGTMGADTNTLASLKDVATIVAANGGGGGGTTNGFSTNYTGVVNLPNQGSYYGGTFTESNDFGSVIRITPLGPVGVSDGFSHFWAANATIGLSKTNNNQAFLFNASGDTFDITDAHIVGGYLDGTTVNASNVVGLITISNAFPNGIVAWDATGSNLTTTLNGSGLTNISQWASLAATNITLTFNGSTTNRFTVTNTPNLFILGGTNGTAGDYTFDIQASNNIYGLFGAGYTWLSGSNANPQIVTNSGVLSISKVGSKTFVALLQSPYSQFGSGGSTSLDGGSLTNLYSGTVPRWIVDRVPTFDATGTNTTLNVTNYLNQPIQHVISANVSTNVVISWNIQTYATADITFVNTNVFTIYVYFPTNNVDLKPTNNVVRVAANFQIPVPTLTSIWLGVETNSTVGKLKIGHAE